MRISVGLTLLFGIWLRWPTLYNGFFSDDMVALAMLKGKYISPRKPLDLFDFADGSATDNGRLMRYGSIPWWTVRGMRLAMMRPLSSLLVIVDEHLFGKHVVLYHLHSLLWWVLFAAAAGALFHDVLDPPLAAAALLLFVLEEAHTFTLGWLANRGALVAMFFCLLGLRLHLRFRRRGELRAAYLSAVCYGIALLCGEWSFTIMAYVFAYEVCCGTGTWRRRALALLPSALPGAVFIVVRGLLGYGAKHSGVYTDPIAEPLRFLVVACQRLPVFFADMLFGIPAHYYGLGTPWRDELLASGLIPTDVWLRMPGWPFWHLLLGSAAILLFVWVVRAVLPRRPPEERRMLRWFVLGMLLSMLPMVSSFPNTRLVLPASLGFTPLCAAALFEWVKHVRQRLRSRAYLRALGPALLAAATLYAQVWRAGERSYGESRGTPHYFADVRNRILEAELDDRDIAHKHVVVLGVLEHTAMVFAPYVRWLFGHPMPASWWPLSAAPYAQEVYRPLPNVLELSTLGGSMLRSETEELYRSERFRMRVGQRVQFPGLKVEILRLIDGFPQTVRFTFDKNVEDPSYVFLFSGPEGLTRTQLPEVGERRRYRRPIFVDAWLSGLMRNLRDPNVSCVGSRPQLDQCREGFFFADCGGHGDPVFACDFANDCRWFLHGCAAENYITSSCRADDVCCQHDWPFEADSFTHESPYRKRLSEGLAYFGTSAAEIEKQFALDVYVDPQLHTRGPDVRCSGPHAERGPCGLGQLDMADAHQNSVYFVYRGDRPANGWALTVEVVDTHAGELRARVCRVATPPLWTADPAAPACHNDLAPVCAERGHVLLNLFPIYQGEQPDLRGKLRAEFDDGLVVEADL